MFHSLQGKEILKIECSVLAPWRSLVSIAKVGEAMMFLSWVSVTRWIAFVTDVLHVLPGAT